MWHRLMPVEATLAYLSAFVIGGGFHPSAESEGGLTEDSKVKQFCVMN